MNVDTDLCITLNRTEAEQMRTALHIATRLAALLPFGLNQPVWAQAFKNLHNSFVDAGVEILPGAPAFSDNVLTALANAEHPDDRLLRDLMDDQSARHVGLTASQTGLVNTTRKKGWIVQYDAGDGAGWFRVVIGPLAGTATYTSRNEAYRQMRARSKQFGYPLSRYRVVPEGTPDGKEKDRGFYTVEFFTKHGRPSELGWNKSGASALTGTFPTAGGAQNAIDSHISRVGENLRSRYRVKWHPSKA